MFVALPKNIKINKEKVLHVAMISALVLGLLQPALFPAKADASATSYLRLDRMKASTATGGTVCTTTTTSGSEADVQVTFPTGFTVNGTAGNWTVTTTNLPTGATPWPGIGTATAVASQTVTFPSTDLSTSTLYCFNFSGTSTLTTGTAGNDKTGSIITRTGGQVAIDTINYATSIISEDQISVTATVPSTFTFSLSGSTAALGTITTTGATSATALTATVSTNANNGFLAWVKSTNAALSSTSTSDTIPSAAFTSGAGNVVDLASTNGYVLDVNTGAGAPTIATEYDGNTTAKGGNLSTAFRQIASATAPVSGNTFDLVVRARASATNKAASDYADTLTVTAAGQF